MLKLDKDIFSKNLGDFIAAAKFHDAGKKRVYINDAGAIKTDTNADKHTVTIMASNTHIVDILENAIIYACDENRVGQQQAALALEDLSQYHQAAEPLMQRDLVRIFAILNLDHHAIKAYTWLKSRICPLAQDPAFILRVKAAYPGTTQKFSLMSISSTDKNIPDIFVSIANRIAKIDIKDAEISSCEYVRNIAKELHSPLAELLTYSLCPQHFTPFPTTNILGMHDYKVQSHPSEVNPLSINKSLNGIFMPHGGHDTSPIPLPVFIVPRDITDKSTGYNRIYNLMDARTALAFIGYLCPEYHDRTTEYLNDIEISRMQIKNLLGSPIWEQCNEERPKNSSRIDFIMKSKFAWKGSPHMYHVPNWPEIVSCKKCKSRPPSFVRLLAISTDIAMRSAQTPCRNHTEKQFHGGARNANIDYKWPPQTPYLPEFIGKGVTHNKEIPPIPSMNMLGDNVRKKMRWEEDFERKLCSSCKKAFNTGTRRHHCRHCGQILCNDCNNYEIYWKSPDSKKENSWINVCQQCFLTIPKHEILASSHSRSWHPQHWNELCLREGACYIAPPTTSWGSNYSTDSSSDYAGSSSSHTGSSSSTSSTSNANNSSGLIIFR